jgi:hypothetical protein
MTCGRFSWSPRLNAGKAVNVAKSMSMVPVEYVLKIDRELPKEEQTKFHIRPLKWRERADVQDGMIVTEINVTGPKNAPSRGVMRHLSGTQARVAVEKGLIRIENLRGPTGEIMKYDESSDATWKETVLDSLNPEWTKEIAEEILIMSGLAKGEEKN